MLLAKDITIVIPTHNRHCYLKRILSYYKKDFKIMIADSTEKKFNFSFFPFLFYKNIEYYHYPNFEYLDKMEDILSKVTTPYVVMCADDDFIVKQSILNSINFLKNNLDFSSVQGRYISFYKEDTDYMFKPIYIASKDLIIDSDFLQDRMNTYMDNYVQVFYAVHRTKHIQAFFLDSKKNNMTNPILMEIGLGLYTIIAGKYKTLQQLYGIRDGQSLSTDVDRTTLDIIVKDSKYVNVYNSFREMTNQFILSTSQQNKDNNILEECINIYCQKREIVKKKVIEKKKAIKQKTNSISKSKEELKLLNKRRVNALMLKIKDEIGYPLIDTNAIEKWNLIHKIIKKEFCLEFISRIKIKFSRL